MLQSKNRAPEPARLPTATRRPPFPVEDRTAPDVAARLAEIQTMRLWTLSERARGNAPN